MEWTRGRILGRGSTATVCAAVCHNSNETFAVKSSELHRSEFLQREAKLLSSLNSPYVIGYRGSETKIESNGVVTYNLLMEYAPYGTLTDAAEKNGGRLEEAMIVKYTREILRGLEYIHSKEIAHCDVKGSNVVVAEKGEAKIADFGCAKRVGSEEVTGTPAFMAPEVARGEKQGSESDIWAVGCTVIEMATGSPPWTEAREDPVSVLYRVGYSGETPELPYSLTEEAKDFLKMCFEKEAKERWTATQLLSHPFLITKPDTEPVLVSGLVSSSPTSVTDQTFWRSLEEEVVEEEEAAELQDESRDLDRLNLWASHSERIGRLRCAGGLDGPRWDVEGGDWITVRVSCEGTMISRSLT